MRTRTDAGQLDDAQSVLAVPPCSYRPFALTPSVPIVRIFAAALGGRAPRSPRVGSMSESAIETLAPVAGLAVTLAEGVLSVTIDRPDSLNSLTTPVLAGIADAMESAATDPRVKVVRLGGSGRGFCSGAGMSADDVASAGPGTEIIAEANRVVRAITALPQPVVAVVHGPAAGVGVSLALACDLVLASETGLFHARLHASRVDARRRRVGVDRRGDRPDPRHANGAAGRAIAGRRRVRPRAWSARSIRPRTSRPRSTRWSRNCWRARPWRTQRPRPAINATTLTELDSALKREFKGQAVLLRSHDFAEGATAFQQRRTPNFTDR